MNGLFNGLRLLALAGPAGVTVTVASAWPGPELLLLILCGSILLFCCDGRREAE
jgi:hypothetical protein